MTKPYSELSWSIDLIMEEFKVKNPIIIAELIKSELDMDFSIHQIADYLDVNRQDYELESKKNYYHYNY